ncbi:hypothetical protein [Erythrobacter sp. YT30]|uniref:hypothetical protein n=1 Tax=Erythrobacter sp. YT30 TaxID=1735012 RepID=UPI00076BFDF7|nr:hypothetical protein [Erythrobacter sp. YT30]KWV91359.1 hypothetical protein AUC45_08795 [Erythrobacter sp. YT30]
MKNTSTFSKIFQAVACVALGLGLAVQAYSSIATRKAPEQSVALFPMNGLADEQRAFRIFQSEAAKGRGLREAARESRNLALIAQAKEPLTPKAYAILAAAQSDREIRNSILARANRLNRRDLALQGFVLEKHLDDQAYDSVLGTLDEMFRVNPDRDTEFFPILGEALAIDEALDAFPSILNGDAEWHDRFLSFAVRVPELRSNLAKIRNEIPIENDEADRILIAGLAAQGELSTARALYANLKSTSGPIGADGKLDWASDFIPFEWRFADDRDFRSQASQDGEFLEVFVRSGQGGVVAERVITLPSSSFTIRTNVQSRGSPRSESLRLLLKCGVNDAPLFDKALKTGGNIFRLEAAPDACSPALLQIRARSLRGEPTLRLELSRIEVKRDK